MPEDISARVAGTNIDQHSLLSTDYFNSFNSVIMLFGMLKDAPELLDEIDEWKFLDYVGHFKASGLDFAPLAIEAYGHVPSAVRAEFETLINEMRRKVENARAGLRLALKAKKTDLFVELAKTTTRELQQMSDKGSGIIHGGPASLDQNAIDKLF